MTVSELIEALSELPQDSEVAVACDAEGNAQHTVEGLYGATEIEEYGETVEGAFVVIYPV